VEFGATIRIGTPSGVVTAEADVVIDDGIAVARSASLYRTIRTLMRGEVAAPDKRSRNSAEAEIRRGV
jgi:2-methylaconitate cis-trans-isomerase PrpF